MSRGAPFKEYVLEEVPLKTYQRLQAPFDDDTGMLRRLLQGLSTHKYHESSALAAEAFGISASSLSKRFKRCSAEKLKQLDQAVFRRRLQDAYAHTTHKEACAALAQAHRELEQINRSAANSLLEGLDETLTIHELGLSVELARSLSTTNCIESLFSQMGAYTDQDGSLAQ